MAFSLDQVKLRHCTISDFKAVLDINRCVYDNFDYLYALFYEWSHDPKYFHIVAEYKDDIIGYKGCYINDRTSNHYLSVAVRVHPDFQGLGLMKKLDEESKTLVSRIHVEKLGERRASLLRNKVVQIIDNSQALQKHLIFHLTVYDKSISDVAQCIPKIEGKNINSSKTAVRLPYHQAKALVTSTKSLAKLSSYAAFLLADLFLIYNINKENLGMIVAKYHHYVTVEEDYCMALSTNSLIQTLDDNLRLTIWYLGPAEVSIWCSHIWQHIVHVINLLQKLPDDKVLHLMVCTPNTIPAVEVEEFLKPIVGEKHTDGHYNVTKAVAMEFTYEKPELSLGICSK